MGIGGAGGGPSGGGDGPSDVFAKKQAQSGLSTAGVSNFDYLKGSFGFEPLDRELDPFLLETGMVEAFEFSPSAGGEFITASGTRHFKGDAMSYEQFQQLYGRNPGQNTEEVYNLYNAAFNTQIGGAAFDTSKLTDAQKTAFPINLLAPQNSRVPNQELLYKDLERVVQWGEQNKAAMKTQYSAWEKQYGKWLGGGNRYAMGPQQAADVNKQTLLSGGAKG